jgi:hypothetical protein
MLHIKGNSVCLNHSSNIKKEDKDRIFHRVNSIDTIQNFYQNQEVLKNHNQISGSQSTLPSKLKKLSSDFYLRSSRSSRYSNNLSMKTQLIQFNTKVLFSRKNNLHSRSNNRLECIPSEKIISKKPKDTLEIFVYSKKYPKIHMNLF